MPRIIDVKSDDFKAEESFAQGRISKRFTITYVILADDIPLNEVTEEDILATQYLPVIGEQLRGAFCQGRQAKEVATHAFLWEVECRFDSNVDLEKIDAIQLALNPENRLPEWEWDGENVDQVIEVDQVTGEPIVNSIGEPLILTGPFVLPILTITRFEFSFSPTVILSFSNRVNTAPFWGAPAGCALMGIIKDRKAQVQMPNGSPAIYRQVTYQIKFNFTVDSEGDLIGWKAQPLNHGTKYMNYDDEGLPSGILPFQDKGGNQTTGNLALDGGKLEQTDDPVYLQFNRFRQANLGLLNLGPF